MDLEQYKEKLELLRARARRDEGELAIDYAYSNNTIKIGDIVTDSNSRIKVESIRVCYRFDGIPECVYRGARYTTKGVPFRTLEKCDVWQSNIKLDK